MAVAEYNLFERMLGIALLRAPTYEEVEADTTATRQALLIVGLVSVATGIGAFLAGAENLRIVGLIVGVVFATVGWLVWAGAILLLGKSYLGASQIDGEWGGLPRTLGFAQSPGILRVFLFVPIIGKWFFLAILIWQLATMVMAVRQALDFTPTSQIIGVVALGFIPYGFLMVALMFWIL